MKTISKQRYEDKIKQVLDYIDQHADQNLSIERLSRISCLSLFHFHRLFSAFTGMSLYQYILFVRLKRAANQLVFTKEKIITDIAFDAGFIALS